VARNYSEVFHKYLEPARNLMREAANITDNASLRRLLISRGDAFLSNDYYQSEVDSVDLFSKIEFTIRPHSIDEDELQEEKTAFEGYVTITEPEESQKSSIYIQLLPEMERNLPVPDEMKSQNLPKVSISVADLVFSSGAGRQSPSQSFQVTLPSDPDVEHDTGTKSVMLRNAMEAYFRGVLHPVANILMKKKQLSQNLLSPEAFFNYNLFRELSYSLGPNSVFGDEDEEVSEALGDFHNDLEEVKSDVMAVYNILFMIQKGVLPKDMTNKVLFTYIVELFDIVREDENDRNSGAVQLNRFLEERSIVFLPNEETYQVNFNKLIASVEKLLKDVVSWQYTGDKTSVEVMYDKYGKLDQTVLNSLDKLTEVAMDWRPCYPLAGEDCSEATKY